MRQELRRKRAKAQQHERVMILPSVPTCEQGGQPYLCSRVWRSRDWRLAEGRGCVQRAPGDRTLLRLRPAGAVRLVTTFAPGRIRADGPRCA